MSASIDDFIRAGTPPDASVIAGLTADVVELGSVGAAAEGERLRSAVLGFGPLEGLLGEPSVTDVVVNGDGAVWVDRGDGMQRADLVLEAPAARALATRLAGLARRRLDDAQPWVDGVLPGGVRLHAILPPLAEGGTHLSLRVPRHQPAGVEGLLALGAVDAQMARTLRLVVDARCSFLVVGGTGAGKTTILGALLSQCPPSDRIVVVEDVRELDPAHPHVVRLQGRGANVEGAGSVTMVDLVRQALRMRPDRLVVGEVRGGEVREMLAALNTGHDGGAATVHANGMAEVPARLEALGALAGLGREALHAQLRGAVQVVIEVRRVGPRRVVSGLGVTRWSESEVVVDPALDVDAATGRVRVGPGAQALDRLLAGHGCSRGVGHSGRGSGSEGAGFGAGGAGSGAVPSGRPGGHDG